MPSESIYWNSMDFDSEDGEMSDVYTTKSPPSSQRHYVDPWDLENYAYIRRHLASTPEPSSTPSPSGEPTDSTFYYVPGDKKKHYYNPEQQRDTTIYSDGRQSAKYSTYVADETEDRFERGGYLRDSLLIYDEAHKTSGRFAQIDEEDFRNDIRYESDLYGSKSHKYVEDDIYGTKEPIYYTKSRKEVLENIYGEAEKEKRNNKSTVQRDELMPYSDIESSSEYDPESPTDVDGSLLYMYETAQRRRSIAVPLAQQNGLKRRYSTAGMSQNQEYARYGSRISNANYYSMKPSTLGKIERSRSLYGRMESEQSIYGRINSHKIYGRVDNNQIYGRIGDITSHPRITPVPIYDDTYVKGVQPKPGNFGLSNYGHLKIDYSCSWSSLDRFIGK